MNQPEYPEYNVAVCTQTDDTLTFQDMDDEATPESYITTDVWADIQEAR